MCIVVAKRCGKVDVVGSLLALTMTGVIAATLPALALADAPGGATGEASAASSAPPDKVAVPGTKPGTLTAEEVRAAVAEAERRRAEAMRPDPGVPRSVTEPWGVEVIRVASTADGFWLDFRFRVTDAEKALPLFDSRIKPYLESEQTGVRLAVPSAAKVGALRTTNRGQNIQADKIYTIMFANPGAQVKPGQRVSIVIGDFKVEHLTVN